MEAHETKLFVGGLVREVDEEILRQHFTKYGAVGRTFVPRDRVTGNPKGHGFVWFCNASSAKQALEDSSGHVILGKTVQVKKPIHRNDLHQNQQDYPSRQQVRRDAINSSCGSQFRTKKIFVGGLPSSLTHEEFKDFFERFGGTTDVVIMFDSVTQRPRGFGFVTFASEESVEAVMRNNYYNIHGRNVEVKRAVPKSGCCTVGPVGGAPWDNNYRPGDYSPCYPAYEAFHSYSYFPGYYATGNYWPPYPVIPGPPSYGPIPFYTNGLIGPSSGAVTMYDGFMTKSDYVTNHADENSIVSRVEDLKLDSTSPCAGDLKLDADSSDVKGGRGTASN